MIQILTDKELLDKDLIYQFLSKSYWASERTINEIDISIDNSLCFAMYKDGQQIAFARVVSDYSVFAYFMDVFVIESEQSNGYGKQLFQYMLDYPPLSLVKNWLLATETAHEFYREFGFDALDDPSMFMRMIK